MRVKRGWRKSRKIVGLMIIKAVIRKFKIKKNKKKYRGVPFFTF
jgi:hypothetical protein